MPTEACEILSNGMETFVSMRGLKKYRVLQSEPSLNYFTSDRVQGLFGDAKLRLEAGTFSIFVRQPLIKLYRIRSEVSLGRTERTNQNAIPEFVSFKQNLLFHGNFYELQNNSLKILQPKRNFFVGNSLPCSTFYDHKTQ